MSDLNVSIVTPEREVYSGPASEVQIPGWEGEFEVLPGHDLVLSLLRGGIAHVTTPSGVQRYIVGRGFAEIAGDEVTLLTDSCELAEQADKTQAQHDLVEIEKVLYETMADTPENDSAIERREIARARITA